MSYNNDDFGLDYSKYQTDDNTDSVDTDAVFQDVSSPDEVTVIHEKKEIFSLKAEIFDWLEIVVTAIILLVVLFTFVFKIVTIDGRSMMNTLKEGEKVVISNIGYEPQHEDIVVISRNMNNITSGNDQSAPIIKRIIATEGQTVNIDFSAGVVYVDGVALDEPYTRTPTNLQNDIRFPVVVPSGCVFVLGDNRNDSTDSRSSMIGEEGMIDTRYILGKALYRIFPFDGFGGLY